MLCLFIKFMLNCGQADGDGCYNLVCNGFVQISHWLGFGATIAPFSTYDGEQRYNSLHGNSKPLETKIHLFFSTSLSSSRIQFFFA